MTVDKSAVRRQHRHRSYRAIQRHPIVLLADNVDKSQNLGGILRLADAFLVEKVLSNRTEPDHVGAMGAEHWQPTEWNVDLVLAARQYQARGYSLVALEQSSDGHPIDKFCFTPRTALVVGAEMFGIAPDLIAVADSVVYIPQAGLVKSLNVVTATAIALYEYSRQHWMPEFEQPSRHLQPSDESMRLERPERFSG